MLVGKLLLSPHAHAIIKRIDASKARALPGVHAVLTHEDVPRVAYTTAGQSHPEPGPHDNYSLDYKVRFVGDRVAAVAAETEEIALRALELIEVEYEILPAIFDPRDSMKQGAPVLHDEPESWHIENKERNLAAGDRVGSRERRRRFRAGGSYLRGDVLQPESPADAAGAACLRHVVGRR